MQLGATTPDGTKNFHKSYDECKNGKVVWISLLYYEQGYSLQLPVIRPFAEF